MNCLRDDALGHLVEKNGKSLVQFQKLRPEGFFDKSNRNAGHDGGVTLPGSAIGRDLIPAHQGDKQSVRPSIAEIESVFDRWIGSFLRTEPGANAFASMRRSIALAWRRCARKERLDQPEFLKEPLLV